MKFWLEIVCDKCAKADHGQFVNAGRVPQKAIAHEAFKDGWLLRTSGEWACPACVAEELAAVEKFCSEETTREDSGR